MGGHNRTIAAARDEENRRTRTYADAFGNAVRAVAGYGTSLAATPTTEYDGTGRLAALAPSARAYDVRGWLVQTGQFNSHTHPFAAAYTHDLSGLIRRTTCHNGGVPEPHKQYHVDHAYDALGRLTEAAYNGSAGGGVRRLGPAVRPEREPPGAQPEPGGRDGPRPAELRVRGGNEPAIFGERCGPRQSADVGRRDDGARYPTTRTGT